MSMPPKPTKIVYKFYMIRLYFSILIRSQSSQSSRREQATNQFGSRSKDGQVSIPYVQVLGSESHNSWS
jgi:hypothetical protein